MTEMCECLNWTRKEEKKFLTQHHPHCCYYDPEGDAAVIINSLLDGIQKWAADEDGVHPDCCDAYDKSALTVGRKTLGEEK
jgi:hypothetical protein